MRRGKTNTYGEKGGEGPTRGKKATTYIVTLPNGSTAKKRTFFPPEGEAVGYAYEHGGLWFVAAINEPNCQHLKHYIQCPAVRQ